MRRLLGQAARACNMRCIPSARLDGRRSEMESSSFNPLGPGPTGIQAISRRRAQLTFDAHPTPDNMQWWLQFRYREIILQSEGCVMMSKFSLPERNSINNPRAGRGLPDETHCAKVNPEAEVIITSRGKQISKKVHYYNEDRMVLSAIGFVADCGLSALQRQGRQPCNTWESNGRVYPTGVLGSAAFKSVTRRMCEVKSPLSIE